MMKPEPRLRWRCGPRGAGPPKKRRQKSLNGSSSPKGLLNSWEPRPSLTWVVEILTTSGFNFFAKATRMTPLKLTPPLQMLFKFINCSYFFSPLRHTSCADRKEYPPITALHLSSDFLWFFPATCRGYRPFVWLRGYRSRLFRSKG